MTRLLLPAGALVLVLTACGAGAKPAPQATQARKRPPSVHVLVARRKAVARREAERLLRRFPQPAGAKDLRRPPASGGVLGRSGLSAAAEQVDVHRFWSVDEPLKHVAAFVRAHRPRGFASFGTEYGSNVPHFLSWGFTWPADRNRSPTRYLDVTAVGLPGRTVVRVDAKVTWIYPRSASERVPAAVREIVVRAPKVDAKVTRPADVGKVVRWFDALPVSPPGIVLACPLEIAPDVRISFLGTGGAVLAHALAPPGQAGLCDAIQFWIGGRPQRPLVDRATGTAFVVRLQRLLGVRLEKTFR